MLTEEICRYELYSYQVRHVGGLPRSMKPRPMKPPCAIAVALIYLLVALFHDIKIRTCAGSMKCTWVVMAVVAHGLAVSGRGTHLSPLMAAVDTS